MDDRGRNARQGFDEDHETLLGASNQGRRTRKTEKEEEN
eukprot:CAMPEP_0203800162 /NCGR_PEP_ID=MMETSP0100_2-20121128/10367_1 /ASSEMBLY_ACC=CAM_ASM_000210 /TAXON_ID=96639 /ORGANISM=" , Strain NY0313808BC1" /LENGTH=38 /DNA_ID= /DNA_START= /DNA_END= /DNA_ORIENTATION=